MTAVNGSTGGTPSTPAGSGFFASLSHHTIAMMFGIVIVLIAWQYKPLKTPIKWIGILLFLGIILREWPTISSQFKKIGA